MEPVAGWCWTSSSSRPSWSNHVVVLQGGRFVRPNWKRIGIDQSCLWLGTFSILLLLILIATQPQHCRAEPLLLLDASALAAVAA